MRPRSRPPTRSARARALRALRAFAALALLAALAAAGPPAGAEAGREAPPERVRPGVNETFLSPGLDVERFEGIFESESREVYAARHAIAEALALEPGMAVADVGAGTGFFLPLLAEAVGPKGRVYAVEIAPRFLEHLHERKHAQGLERLRVVEGGARDPRLPEAGVDVVLTVDTYHHFEYPAAMLEGLRRAIRPGGALVVIDFERDPETSRDWVLEHVRAGRTTVREEIEAAGFRLEEALRIPGLEENYALRFRRP